MSTPLKHVVGAAAPPSASSTQPGASPRLRELLKKLDPDAPGLDEDTRKRRRALAALAAMTTEEQFQVAVRAGIYTPDGQLTEPYRDDGEPSACRPTD
jgi:hypothetical protein